MDKALFDEMALVEDYHWWFRARKQITLSLLRRHLPALGGLVVGDFGTGTGHMLEDLREFGVVYGLESSPDALAYAVAKGVADVRFGSLPKNIPYPKSFFDAILMQDVLEHIQDAPEALKSVRDYLKPGGILLLTVPAVQALYCGRDRFHGHVKRYDREAMTKELAYGGMETVFLSYYNFFLFFPTAAVRMWSKHVGADREAPDIKVFSGCANTLLEKIFAYERKWLERGRVFPFGVSIVAVARR